MRYEGEWRDNKKHGKGTYTWADGMRWVREAGGLAREREEMRVSAVADVEGGRGTRLTGEGAGRRGAGTRASTATAICTGRARSPAPQGGPTPAPSSENGRRRAC